MLLVSQNPNFIYDDLTIVMPAHQKLIKTKKNDIIKNS